MKRRQKVDPKERPFLYAVDLRDRRRIAGELSFSFLNMGTGRNKVYELFSCPKLTLWGKLENTENSKMKKGMDVCVGLTAEEGVPTTNIIGFVEKEDEILHFYVYLPVDIINHIHLSFLSSRPEMMHIFGTELYYRKGQVRGIDLVSVYEEEEC